MTMVTQLSAEDVFFASSGVSRICNTTHEQQSEKTAYVPIIHAEFAALPESRLV
jgi:hypothetical protein